MYNCILLCFSAFSCILFVIANTQDKYDRVPPGGQKVMNVTDPRAIRAAATGIEAINQMNGYSDDVLREVVARIANATEQVVNGELYRLLLDVGPSECFNNLDNIGKSAKECPLLSPRVVHRCFTEVLNRNWTNPQNLIINVTCDEQSTIASRNAALDVTDPQVRHAADLAVNELNRIAGYSCCTYKDVVASIESASSEDRVNGNGYHLVVKIGKSFCTNNINNKDSTAVTCQIQPGLQLRTCNIHVTLDRNNKLLAALVNHHCSSDTTQRPAKVVG